jgi:hypothetical protein
MIQLSELRTGNILNYDTAEGDILPTKIDWQDLKWLDEDARGFNLVHTPIPISEDILVKCGFEEIYKSQFTLRFDYEPNTKFGAGWNLVNGHFHVRYIREQFTHIKFLHQLQNLYYALTGTDLIIQSLERGEEKIKDKK